MMVSLNKAEVVTDRLLLLQKILPTEGRLH